jgi:putative DNA primase/helicase
MGSPEYDARYYEFKETLYKQFLSDVFLAAPKRNEDKVLINLQNGTMEFSEYGGYIRESRPEDFITYQLSHSHDKNATCPIFENYLNEVLPDENSRMILQEFAGYILQI